jgi:hypothetical protein
MITLAFEPVATLYQRTAGSIITNWKHVFIWLPCSYNWADFVIGLRGRFNLNKAFYLTAESDVCGFGIGSLVFGIPIVDRVENGHQIPYPKQKCINPD